MTLTVKRCGSCEFLACIRKGDGTINNKNKKEYYVCKVRRLEYGERRKAGYRACNSYQLNRVIKQKEDDEESNILKRGW